jgi:hypothetical protein
MKKARDEIEIKVLNQGAPIVNDGYVVASGENVVALHIDLRSKYCYVLGAFRSGNGETGLLISANGRSIYLDESKDRSTYTQISFQDF